jgi:hypothetical protein
MTVSRRRPTSKRTKPARTPPRRRRRRLVSSLYGDLADRNAYLGNLVHSATPPANFYPRCFLSGLIFAAAIFFDLRPLYILAVIAAPFLAPLAGLSLATVSGSFRLFLNSLGGLLLGALLTAGAGALGGLAARTWPELAVAGQANQPVSSWADFLLLTIAAIALAVSLYRRPAQTPRLPGAALAYALLLPLVSAGYALAAGAVGVLRSSLITFALRLELAVLISAMVFVLMGLRLRMRDNTSMAGSFALAAFFCLLFLGAMGLSAGGVINPQGSPPPEPTPTAATSAPVIQATRQITPSPAANTPSPEPSPTATPTEKPTPSPSSTATAQNTPYPAVVWVRESAGAFIRAEPAGAVTGSAINGTLVEVQSGYPETTINGDTWVYIKTNIGIEGWIMKSLLDIDISTPMP